jgi:hypothetical protein
MTTATGPVDEERTDGRVDFADSRSLQWWTTVFGGLCVSGLFQWVVCGVIVLLDRRIGVEERWDIPS